MNDQSQKAKTYDLSGFSVMIVEDYPFIAELLSTALKHMGVGKVFTKDSGLSARDKLLIHNKTENMNNIDFVILDWLMPGMGGEEFLRWLRSQDSEKMKFLPVIVCSAYTSEKIVNASRDAGANEVLVKPVSAEKIASRIQYVIENPRAFVKAPGFFGPDRRRKNEEYKGEERRKNKLEDMDIQHEQ